ncbi:VOC family protein [Szabonella alba]|uniref:VOC family protein n=1 Tax=Szabonella alba TaxID=2804194 RepID=A0A8K0Y143_9RHOB|nr:VOC family protein [Szabonella alba]MBL4918466.1 VOC family protein [Szabonella alba]
MSGGLHHVTAITARVQANVDFYAGFLGLRLVKQTAGFADGEQLHLFYGDAAASPGSLVSFLVWEAGGRGRTGHGQPSEIALAVPPASIGDWLARALSAQVPVEGPLREFGEPVLRLKDPDGIIVKLVGVDLPATAPLPDPIAPTRLRAVTLLTAEPGASAEFVARFGYREGAREGATLRMVSGADAVDLRDATGFFPAIPGTGMIDHVAFRAADADTLRATRRALGTAPGLTEVHDRRYFLSLYVREPGGILIEQATDGPGFAIDETVENLGQTLVFPPHEAARAAELRVMLPQFARPGEERIPMRDLPFIHRLYRPEDPDGSVLVLLHGTGGNESDLMPLAHSIAPHATLLGVRGRSTEEGINRWFRRFDAVTYDQDDIRAEAAAFAGFVDGALRSYGLEADRMTFLGYSNGANLLGAMMLLHPGTVRRAILLRGIAALEKPPAADLAGSSVLLLTGAQDPFARMAPALEASLRQGGAALDARLLPAGHGLTEADREIAAGWI